MHPFKSQLLVGGPQESNWPSWSTHALRTDGKNKIAYQFGASGVRGIHIINPDGTGDVRVTFASGDKINPSWSPDGQFFVYSKEPTGSSEYDLWIHRVSDNDDGNDRDLLTRPSNSDLNPAWSPDGKTIAFTTQTGALAAIAVQGVREICDQNGICSTIQIVPGTFRILTDNLFADFHPSWSLDSKFITFSSTRSGGHHIYRMNATQGESDSTSFIQLTTSSANDTNPAWSPDGRTIAFTSDRSGNTEAYLMSAEQGEVAGVTNVTNSSSGDGNPQWMPMPSWQPLRNMPSFPASTAMLLTNGTVMVQQLMTSRWWKLTPDVNGSYIKGKWLQLHALPAGYGPLYYASAVLSDGKVVVEGGEDNLAQMGAYTKRGAIYDPSTNSWASLTPPPLWAHIGDAQSAVLSSGIFMLGSCGRPGTICTHPRQQALLDPATLTWTLTGSGKADANTEEGWTLLPDGSILTVDVSNAVSKNSERYLPNVDKWITSGSTMARLVDSKHLEVGPAVLRPDGSVFATGATGNNAIYNSSTGIWSATAKFPKNAAGKQLAIPDGPAALLPGGNVLCDASPVIEEDANKNVIYPPGSQFFEFDGANLLAVPNPANAPMNPAYVGRMLVLPTGQILLTDGTNDVEIYTSSGVASSPWAPTITLAPPTVTRGGTNYLLQGTQFNGLSQGAAYGDDAQSATNYPLVRITNNTTGHVFYAKTHGHSTMGVATGPTPVSTMFDVVPVGTRMIETGMSTLVVIANGIASDPVNITVN